MKKIIYIVPPLAGLFLLSIIIILYMRAPASGPEENIVQQNTMEEINPEESDFLYPVSVYKQMDGQDEIILSHTEYRTGTGEEIGALGIEDTGYFEYKEETPNGYLYPAKRDGVWGYISPSGEWAIMPQYVFAESFHDGYALVVLEDDATHRNTSFAYIDPFGEKLIEWEFPEMVGPIREGRAVRYLKTDQSKTMIDIIDVFGNILVPNIVVDTDSLRPKYHSGISQEEGRFLAETLHYSQGLLCVSINGEYGYLNIAGEWEIPPQYSYAEDFSEERAIVGEGEGYYETCYGYINLDGEQVIPMIYSQAWPFSEGKAAVLLDRDTEKVQFIYPDGSIAFAGGAYSLLKGGMQISEYEPLIFREGFCVIYEESSDYQGITYIDSDGNNMREIWQLDLHDIGANGRIAYATSFRNGLSRVSDGTSTWYMDQEGRKLFEAVEKDAQTVRGH